MNTAKAQRSTISALRASSSHLVQKCRAQEDCISTLTCEKERLEAMVHHLRIGIAKLASITEHPAIDETVSDCAEELTGPYVDYEDFLKNFASFKDSLCDLLYEEADEEFTAAAEVKAESSPASVDTESAPHTPSTIQP